MVDADVKPSRLIRRGSTGAHHCVACCQWIKSGERMTIEEFDGVFLDRDRYCFYHARCHPTWVDRAFKRIPKNHWRP